MVAPGTHKSARDTKTLFSLPFPRSAPGLSPPQSSDHGDDDDDAFLSFGTLRAAI